MIIMLIYSTELQKIPLSLYSPRTKLQKYSYWSMNFAKYLTQCSGTEDLQSHGRTENEIITGTPGCRIMRLS